MSNTGKGTNVLSPELQARIRAMQEESEKNSFIVSNNEVSDEGDEKDTDDDNNNDDDSDVVVKKETTAKRPTKSRNKAKQNEHTPTTTVCMSLSSLSHIRKAKMAYCMLNETSINYEDFIMKFLDAGLKAKAPEVLKILKTLEKTND